MIAVVSFVSRSMVYTQVKKGGRRVHAEERRVLLVSFRCLLLFAQHFGNVTYIFVRVRARARARKRMLVYSPETRTLSGWRWSCSIRNNPNWSGVAVLGTTDLRSSTTANRVTVDRCCCVTRSCGGRSVVPAPDVLGQVLATKVRETSRIRFTTLRLPIYIGIHVCL